MILNDNTCYYAYKHLMKNKILNRAFKLKIYKTISRFIVTYVCETWTLTGEVCYVADIKQARTPGENDRQQRGEGSN